MAKKQTNTKRQREQIKWLTTNLLEVKRTLNIMFDSHDCDVFSSHLGDNEYECQLCGNSWEQL